MRINAKDSNALSFKVVDLDTGKALDLILSADEQTGEYVQCATDADGHIKTVDDQVVEIHKRGNIRIEPRKQLMIYIAGPYTANTREEVKAHIARAEAVGQKILEAGHIPIIPHKITSFWDEKGPLKDWPHENWLKKFCLPLLDRCDAAFFLPGWDESKGATIEYHHAVEKAKPRYFDLEVLCLRS